MIQNLPSFYKSFFPAEWASSIVQDRAANCSNCSMAQGKNPVYRADLKCCTYYPYWPNFLMGEFLVQHPEGSKSLSQMMKNRQYVLPIGCVAPPSYQFKFNFNKLGYGNNEDLLCPFYDQGQCTVWSSRSNECARFFCMSQFGETGKTFWQNVGDYLHHIDMILVQETLLEMGYGWNEIEDQLEQIKVRPNQDPEDKKWVLSSAEQKHFWQHRELTPEFFIQCYELAKERGVEWLKSSQDLVQKREQVYDLHSQIVKGIARERTFATAAR